VSAGNLERAVKVVGSVPSSIVPNDDRTPPKLGDRIMPKARIVVVEDEPAIRRGLVDALRLTGYEVSEAADGRSGLKEAESGGVDLVLLDLMLPLMDGFQVLAELRRKFPARPVIILTAKGGEDDRVRGLKMGADDYIVKPFSARELVARVEAVLRRTLKPVADIPIVLCGRARIDLHRREICWSDSERVDLSETEAAVLQYLVGNRDRAVSREELLGRVWGIGTAGLETRAVDMHVARLRAKLKDPNTDDTPDVILTVRSLGYMAGPSLRIPENSRTETSSK
jgi:DNA-binding response OmpR family regulator